MLSSQFLYGSSWWSWFYKYQVFYRRTGKLWPFYQEFAKKKPLSSKEMLGLLNCDYDVCLLNYHYYTCLTAYYLLNNIWHLIYIFSHNLCLQIVCLSINRFTNIQFNMKLVTTHNHNICACLFNYSNTNRITILRCSIFIHNTHLLDQY